MTDIQGVIQFNSTQFWASSLCLEWSWVFNNNTHTCAHTHVHTDTHARTQTHAHTRAHAHTHTCTCTHACTHTHAPEKQILPSRNSQSMGHQKCKQKIIEQHEKQYSRNICKVFLDRRGQERMYVLVKYISSEIFLMESNRVKHSRWKG